MNLNLFPENVSKYERIFRFGLMCLAGIFGLIGLCLLMALGTTGLDSAESVIANPFVNYSIMIVMLSFLILLTTLFIFAVLRLIITVITKQYRIALGYLIYLAPLSLLMLPIFFGLYDKYKYASFNF
jgi:hypothetical protein